MATAVQADPSSAVVAGGGGGGGMAWVVSKRDLIKTKFSTFRAKLPLPADVVVATAGGCVQVKKANKKEKSII